VYLEDRNKLMGTFRTAPDLLTRYVQVHLTLGPADALNLLRRQQNALTWQPVARIHDQMPNGPALIVENEVVYTADRAVASHRFVADDIAAATQM
jgi:hypothetical protein